MNFKQSPTSLHQQTPIHLVHSALPVVPKDRLIRIHDVTDKTGLSRTTIYQLMKDGSFPKQIKLSSRCAVWPESAVLQWVQDRIQGGSHA